MINMWLNTEMELLYDIFVIRRCINECINKCTNKWVHYDSKSLDIIIRYIYISFYKEIFLGKKTNEITNKGDAYTFWQLKNIIWVGK